jgi:hypothetical protein
MDPFLLSMILGGASGITGMMGANQSAEALQAAINAEIARQQNFDERMFAVNDRALGRYGGARAGIRQEGRQIGDYLKRGAGGPDTATPSASGLVAQTEAMLKQQAKGKSNAKARSAGKLRAMGDYFGGMQRGMNNDAIALSQLAGQRGRSLDSAGLEWNAAGKAGNGMSALADLLAAGSSMASGYGNNKLTMDLLSANLGGSPAAPTDPWAGLRSATAANPYVRVG